MGLKEMCAQWFAFREANTACSQRHDCLRAGAVVWRYWGGYTYTRGVGAKEVCAGMPGRRERGRREGSERGGVRVPVPVPGVSLIHRQLCQLRLALTEAVQVVGRPDIRARVTHCDADEIVHGGRVQHETDAFEIAPVNCARPGEPGGQPKGLCWRAKVRHNSKPGFSTVTPTT